MTIYYIDPCIRVTHKVIEIYGPPCRVFAIRELRQVSVIRGSADPVAAWTPVSASSTGLLGVVATAAVTGSPAFGSVSWTAVTLTAIAASSAGWAAYWYEKARPYELRAVYRGRLVCLVELTDGRRFRQVRNAVLEAIEQRVDCWSEPKEISAHECIVHLERDRPMSDHDRG